MIEETAAILAKAKDQAMLHQIKLLVDASIKQQTEIYALQDSVKVVRIQLFVLMIVQIVNSAAILWILS